MPRHKRNQTSWLGAIRNACWTGLKWLTGILAVQSLAKAKGDDIRVINTCDGVVLTPYPHSSLGDTTCYVSFATQSAVQPTIQETMSVDCLVKPTVETTPDDCHDATLNLYQQATVIEDGHYNDVWCTDANTDQRNASFTYDMTHDEPGNRCQQGAIHSTIMYLKPGDPCIRKDKSMYQPNFFVDCKPIVTDTAMEDTPNKKTMKPN